MGLNKIKINDVTTINTGVVYDISKATGQTYETLSDALSGNNVPLEVREGGMSVRYVQTSDNKYVQYRLMSDTFSTIESDWQGVDDEPTAGSDNLVKSGGVAYSMSKISGATYTQDNTVSTLQSRWVNDNGVVSIVSSTIVYRVERIKLFGDELYGFLADLSWADVKAAYFCDEDGIIKGEIEKGTTGEVAIPEGAEYIHVNYANSFSFRLNGIEDKIKTFVQTLNHIVPNYFNAENPKIGDILYSTESKKFQKFTSISPKQVVEVTDATDVIWLFNNHLYMYDGTTLKSTENEQVIELYAFSTSAPSGISNGQYYFNTNSNKLYRNNGTQYNSTEVALSNSTIYIYNHELYYWNGATLVKYFDEVDDKIDAAILEYQSEYGARVSVDNVQPLALTESDFESGNLQGGTGIEFPATNVIRSGFIPVVPGVSVILHTTNNYRHSIFQFKGNKSFNGNDFFRADDVTVTLQSDTEYIRLLVASPSGVETTPVWEDAGFEAAPSKVYEFFRSASEETIAETVNNSINSYYNLEMPIFAPSPQPPANSEQGSDFNIETVTSTELHASFENLINGLSAPNSGSYYSPKILNRYEVNGMDASNTYPIYTYSFGTRDRYAWRYSDELYAWKNGSTIVYIDSCCPRQGDTIYSDAVRTASGKTVASYNSSTGVMVDSSNTEYTRNEESNVDADMIWTSVSMSKSATTSTIYTVYDRNGNTLGAAAVVDSTHISINGKTYTRSECFDYDTNHKMTIFIWANEHGPTSDPLEPSVILYRMVKDLTVGCKNNPFLSFLKEYCKIVFIPCANPWGAQYPRVYGRVNSNGVNINRNYDTPGWSVQSDSDKGSAVGSENETQYIMNMCNRFKPNVAIDIHCLGFGNPVAEGLMYFSETAIPNNYFYQKAIKSLRGYGFLFDQRGVPLPNEGAHGSEWLYFNDVIGGVFEMNAGAYSDSSHTYNGKQHTPEVMEACYTELLNCLRCWFAQFDGSINLSRLCIK